MTNCCYHSCSCTAVLSAATRGKSGICLRENTGYRQCTKTLLTPICIAAVLTEVFQLNTFQQHCQLFEKQSFKVSTSKLQVHQNILLEHPVYCMTLQIPQTGKSHHQMFEITLTELPDLLKVEVM